MFRQMVLGSSVSVTVFALMLGILYIAPSFYVALTQESRNFELLTALFYLYSGIILVWYTLSKYRANNSYLLIIPLLLGVFFVFIAGEEESWGQWLFQFNTPDSIKEVNIQNEVNIHNLHLFYGMLNPHFVLNMFILLFGIVVPFMYNMSTFVRDLMNKLHIPAVSPFLIGWFAVSLLYEKGMRLIFTSSTFEHWRHTEVMEFLFSVGILIFAINVLKNNMLSQRV